MMTTCFRQLPLADRFVLSNALPVLSVLLFLAGCRGTDATLRERVPGDPSTWQTLRVRQHLSFLNSDEMKGRAAASAGAAAAARYLAERLGESGYQPVLAGEYRTTQSVPLWTLDGSAFSVTGRDTIRFTQGVDYLVDGRSGAGFVYVQRGVRVGSSGVYGAVAVAPSSDVQADEIGGARLAVVTESARLASGPPLVTGVPVVFPLVPFRERLGWPTMPDGRRAAQSAPSRVMPDVRVDVRKTRHASAPIVQVAGMLPGRGIQARDSLVVLLAPYDGYGVQGERSWTDGGDLAIGAAALLEVAVRSGVVQRNWRIFDRSIMIAFVSGTRGESDGASAWLDVLPWAKDHVSHVILVSDDESTPGRPSGVSVFQSARIMRISPAADDTSVVGQRLRESPFGILPRDELLRGRALDATAVRTLDLAERIYDRLLEAAAVRRNEL